MRKIGPLETISAMKKWVSTTIFILQDLKTTTIRSLMRGLGLTSSRKLYRDTPLNMLVDLIAAILIAALVLTLALPLGILGILIWGILSALADLAGQCFQHCRMA